MSLVLNVDTVGEGSKDGTEEHNHSGQDTRQEKGTTHIEGAMTSHSPLHAVMFAVLKLLSSLLHMKPNLY